MARLTAVTLAATILALGAMAGAEHEVYYRYVVLGVVTDGQGRPVPGATVEVIRDRTGFSYLADTDATGLYVAIVRLGDESVGETLTVRARGVTARLTVRFDPANHVDERGTRLDLDGDRVVERPAWFGPTLARWLGSSP